ncbi:MAG TPA: glycosyltransferase family 2 protein [Ramlibacter sp.]|nr:glycosyltransferase family 2 protein [Ramlibacter sp.]
MPDKKDPALASFAAQVEALRVTHLPAKVGVMIPTYNRPDLLRLCVMQFAAQSRAPDIICVHQNGVSDSYRWVVDDLKVAPQIVWLHTPVQLPQHQWYSIPLNYLIEQGCSHVFWADHGDLYLRDHIDKGLEDLRHVDFAASPRAALLFTAATEYRLDPDHDFSATPPGGLAAGMCFNRRFARGLLADLDQDDSHMYTHDVVGQVTCPRFRCRFNERRTAIHHPNAPH